MKQFEKLGLIFITDLVWQKQTPKNKISLKQYYLDCGFNLFSKYSNRLGTSYGFGRLDISPQDKAKYKKINFVSLAVWILESYFDENQNVVDSLLVCFCFDRDAGLYGYIAMTNGTVLPEDGEYIGTADEVRAKIKTIVKQYQIKTGIIAEDVPFHNDPVLEYETGIKLIVITDNDRRLSSDEIFWNPSKRIIKPKLKASRLKFIDLEKNKKILSLFVLVFIVVMVGYFVKVKFFEDAKIEDIQEQVTALAKPSSYPAKLFIETCIGKYNHYAINNSEWSTSSFKCDLNTIELSYTKQVDAKLTDLTGFLGESVTYTAQGATAKFKLNLPNNQIPMGKVDKYEVIDLLNDAGLKLNFTVNINQNKVDINSNYSPMFLFENHIIDKLNLSEISMTQEQQGFNNWHIIGVITDAKE